MKFIIDYRKIKISDCNDIVYYDAMFVRCKLIEHDGETYTIIFSVVPDHHVIRDARKGRVTLDQGSLATMAFIIKGDLMNMLEDAMERVGYFKVSNFPFGGLTNLDEDEIFGNDQKGIDKLIESYSDTTKRMEEINNG